MDEFLILTQCAGLNIGGGGGGVIPMSIFVAATPGTRDPNRRNLKHRLPP